MIQSIHLNSILRLPQFLRHSLLQTNLDRQSGSSLVLALLFLAVITLLVVESTEINRMYFQAAENYKVSKHAEAFADETCHYAHRMLERMFGELSENNALPDFISLKLNEEDLYVSIAANKDSEDTSKWPILMTVDRGEWYGAAHYRFQSIQYTSVGNHHKHFEEYRALYGGVELLEMTFALRCEGRFNEKGHGSAWIYRDYRLLKLRNV